MRIGLTYTGTPEKHQNYVRWLQDGEDIEIIKLEDAAGVDRCDALVLSGGVDIHPSFYGGGLDYRELPKDGWKLQRDELEKAALERSWEQGKPVLGVCRGLQLINVALGGTLLQDLGEKGDEVHQNTGADKRHTVLVEPGTILYTVSGPGGEVNSAHHQAIGELGKGLRVNSRGEDGVIEGIEWADPGGRPFMLAVQWHPERMYTNGFRDEALYRRIRNRFMEAIKKQHT